MLQAKKAWQKKTTGRRGLCERLNRESEKAFWPEKPRIKSPAIGAFGIQRSNDEARVRFRGAQRLAWLWGRRRAPRALCEPAGDRGRPAQALRASCAAWLAFHHLNSARFAPIRNDPPRFQWPRFHPDAEPPAPFHFSDKFLDQELRKGGERLNGLELLGRAALHGAARGGEESLGGARQVAQERGFGILRPRVGRRAKHGFAHAFALGRQVNRDRSGCAFRMRPAENLRRNGLFRNEGLSCRVWGGLADAPKVSVLFGGGFVFRASRGARAGLLGFGDVPKSDRRGGVGRAGGLAGGGFGVERVGHGKLQNK